MRTGNGRHRRPRQAPALFVTASVTGAGIALPLLAAGGAHAADVSTWDRVAQCESGGEWSADPGDGHYGGLSLTRELWRSFGGTTYAPRPDLASRSQQITVAEAILAAQGPDAWTTCARDAHLERGDVPADVDPGLPLPGRAPAATDSTGSGQGSDPSAPSASGSTSADHEDATDGPAAGDSAAGDSIADDPSGSGRDGEADATSPAPAPSATHGDEHGSAEASAGDGATAAADGAAGNRQGEKAGRHRGAPDPSEGNGEVTKPVRGQGDAAASRGGADGRGARGDGSYTVRTGDNLSVIADAHRVDGGWQGLYDANRSVVGADPDLILPGQQLRLDS
ncbi:transglycosylase family protein [Streptomyces sp. NPDC059740]|uniref:transglycosylase family protein n=1 Tax=Streptomyces sp. NPDC059740 TaxID=3346926 RepID=UPI0036628BC0